jgi:hypothetical protein
VPLVRIDINKDAPAERVRVVSHTALDLGRRRIGEIGQMALAGVDHQHPHRACRRQHRADRLDRARKPADVIAERLAEAAGLHKVALHVDNDERGGRPVERDRLRLGDERACIL